MNDLLLYTGAAIVIFWGIAHVVFPTRSILDGFGSISADNRRILLMEWLMEGVLLVFIGVLVVLVTWFTSEAGAIVYWSCAGILAVMAGVSLFTGARTPILPMKLCPPIFLTSAALFVLATVS